MTASEWTAKHAADVTVTCPEHLEQVFAYAESIGKQDSLIRALDQAAFPTFFGHPAVTVLTQDFAPYSFYFMVYIKGQPEWVMNGGVIYHRAWKNDEPVETDGDWTVNT